MVKIAFSAIFLRIFLQYNYRFSLIKVQYCKRLINLRFRKYLETSKFWGIWKWPNMMTVKPNCFSKLERDNFTISQLNSINLHFLFVRCISAIAKFYYRNFNEFSSKVFNGLESYLLQFFIQLIFKWLEFWKENLQLISF